MGLDDLLREVAIVIPVLWDDGPVKQCYQDLEGKDRIVFHLCHTVKEVLQMAAGIFFDPTDRIAEPDYLPNHENIARCPAWNAVVLERKPRYQGDTLRIIEFLCHRV